MKFINRRIGIICCLLIVLIHSKAQLTMPFRMPVSSDIINVPVNKNIQANDIFNILDGSSKIYGFSIDMDIEAFDTDFLIRILLTDKDSIQYLVADIYKETSDKRSMSFSNYSEETLLLNGVIPSQLSLYVKNANVQIHSVKMALSPPNHLRSPSLIQTFKDSVMILQAQAKVDMINLYNKTHNKLWRAGVTKKCLLPYKTKMSLIGCPDSLSTGGIEYYTGGIFEFGSQGTSERATTSSFRSNPESIKSFDWRNAHGKNWVTSVKNQYHYPYCTAFASIGTLESGVQLHYNQIIDTLDLSEKDAVVNHVPGSPLFMIANDGSWSPLVLEYLKNHGVCDEASFPFFSTIPYSSVQPNMIVSIENYDSLRYATKEQKKMALLTKGPMVSGYSYHGRNGHAMELIGFGTIQENMDIFAHGYFGTETFKHDTIPILEGDIRIGDTYWVFKNSYGDDNPYLSILFSNEYYDMDGPYYLKSPINLTLYDEGIITKEYDEDDIICEDADGDGYYFWGIGPKPSTCPEYAMYLPDFDDSNPFIGSINSNGIIENINPEERDTIDLLNISFIEYDHHCYNHLVLLGGEYTDMIYDIYFHNGAKIFLRSGSELTLRECILYNVEIIMEPGSKLIIDEGAKIKLRHGTSFEAPMGAIVEIIHGSIEQ